MDPKNFSKEQISQLEDKFSELLNDAIEIEVMYPNTDGNFTAYIVYDGTNNKANKGTIEFRCHVGCSQIEDLVIVNLTGRNFVPHEPINFQD